MKRLKELLSSNSLSLSLSLSYVLLISFVSITFLSCGGGGGGGESAPRVVDYSKIFKQKDQIEGLSQGSISYADVNGDGNVDIIMTGIKDSAYHTRLYMNDGNGNFTKNEQSSDGASPVFTGVAMSSSNFADIDKDGDLDLIVVGMNKNTQFTMLYTNDGKGVFTKDAQSSDGGASAVFTGVYSSSSVFADIDNDGDIDLLVIGLIYGTSNTVSSVQLYLNNGSGIFAKRTNSGLTSSAGGQLCIKDFDGDGWLDVVITGSTGSQYGSGWTALTHFFINNKNGTFTKSPQSSGGTSEVFVAASSSSIDTADIDGDGDMDIVVTGSPYSVRLYVNDGKGNFTKNNQSSDGASPVFTAVYYGSAVFGDVDGDKDPDLLITGQASGTIGSISQLYTNDGSGNFTKDTQSSDSTLEFFEGVYQSSAAIIDIDKDSDLDLIITGYSSTGIKAFVHRNNGKGKFPGIKAVSYSSQSYADVDKDGDLDLLVTGSDYKAIRHSDLYLNDGKGNFFNASAGLTGVQNGSSSFADIDKDGDADIIITGASVASTYITHLYINNGNGVFTKSEQSSDGTAAVFAGVQHGASVFGDVDNNGYLDLVISGTSSAGIITRLYLNNGGNFTLYSPLPANQFRGVSNSALALGDFDKDGDLDLVLTGVASGTVYALIYTNSKVNDNKKCFGSDLFENLGTTSLTAINYGTVDFADVDGDGWLDLLITGSYGSYSPAYTARFYLNNGTQDKDPFVFADKSLTGVIYSTTAFGDVDMDGDLDLVQAGLGGTSQTALYKAELRTGDGKGEFTLQEAGLSGVENGAISLADFDGNGYPDLIITGHYYKNSVYYYTAAVYYNQLN